MTYRKSEHPVTLIALVIVSWAVVAAASISYGTRLGIAMRECPVKLPDGRVLASLNIKTGQCNYSRVPVQHDAIERGRIKRAQARMEAVK